MNGLWQAMITQFGPSSFIQRPVHPLTYDWTIAQFGPRASTWIKAGTYFNTGNGIVKIEITRGTVLDWLYVQP